MIALFTSGPKSTSRALHSAVLVCLGLSCAGLSGSLASCAEDEPIRSPIRRGLGGQTSHDPGPHADRFRQQAQRLRNGMTRPEVYKILGEPESFSQGGGVTRWRYGSPRRPQLVCTFRDGRLATFDFAK